MRGVDQRLLSCARNGDLDGVVSALDAGADIDVRGSRYGWTALMLVALHGHTETVDRLIQAGANMFIKDKSGRTALDIAIEKGHTQIAELIKQRMKMMEQERSIESASIYDMSRWV